jgi:hypothetical protein
MVNDDKINISNKKEITITYKNKEDKEVSKIGYWFVGKELMGKNGIQYREDGLAGVMIAFRSTKEVKLNSDLH